MAVTLRSRAAEVVSRLRHQSGSEPVPVADLISPLRYDILVRRNFFALLAADREGFARDPESLIAAATGTAYFTWFREVAVARYHAARMGDDTWLADAFRARVLRSAALYDSFQERGFDAAHPLSLRRAQPGASSPSGKVVTRQLYAGDGCHRLALLHLTGVTHLPPSYYLVRRQPLAALTDNTATLLELLHIDEPTYAAFLSLAYADQTFDDVAALEEDLVARNSPRLDEFRAVVAADLRPGRGIRAR